MTRPHVAFVLFVILLALFLFLRPRHQSLVVEAVPASCDAPVNPCLTMSCEAPKGPFGGVDPDAGERDQRRIV